MYLVQLAHVATEIGGNITQEEPIVAHVDPVGDPDPESEAARCGPQSRSYEYS